MIFKANKTNYRNEKRKEKERKAQHGMVGARKPARLKCHKTIEFD